MKRITIFPVNVGEHFDFEVLKELCLQEDNVHLLVNDIDFFKKVTWFVNFGIGAIQAHYRATGGPSCSAKGCSQPKRPLSIIDEADYRHAQQLLPPEVCSLKEVAEALRESSEQILIDKCIREDIKISGAFTERKLRNRIAWIRKRNKLTSKFLEHGLINQKMIPLCKGIISALNYDLQKTYKEIHYVIPLGEKDIFENGLIATKNVFCVDAEITFSTYTEKEPAAM